MPYSLRLISMEEKEELVQKVAPRVRYEVKSGIYGCCIKLLSDDPVLRGTWQENFYSMSADIRSHGRLFIVADPSYPSDTVLYDPYSKTLFLFNVRYYGWVKSLALACAGDILEDEHGIFSLHGACIDIDGRGICLAGTSGAGKTTQTYGLLTDPHSRIIADDWFFARIFSPDIIAYSSEKNFYIRQDLATIWKDFSGLKKADEFDADGRAVADIRWVVGKGRIFPLTTLRTVIVLKRDRTDTEIVQKIDAGSGKDLFAKNSYYNPHMLVRNARKTALRDRFIAALLERTDVYSVNTTGTPAETQERIRTIAGIAPGKK